MSKERRMEFTEGFQPNGWFDGECKSLKKKKNKVLREEGKSSRRYWALKKEFKNMCKRKKRQYAQRRTKELEMLRISSPKEYWKFLRKGFDKNRVINNISAEKWFSYFQNLVSAPKNMEEDGIEEEEEFEDILIRDFLDANDFLEQEITEMEVKNRIRYSLRYHKATGLDGISNDIMKYGIEWIAKPLTNIFNGILRLEYFPERWNKVIMVPFYKSGDADDPVNYRGISLLGCVGKLFAAVLNRRLSIWIEDNNYLSIFQGGFRRHRGCSDQSFILVNTINTVLSKVKRNKVYACFVDFKKAYDRVQHHLLWKKLQRYGLGEKVINLLKSLYSRVDCAVRVEDEMTNFFQYLVGVKQGCILSPLLFNLFINDLDQMLRDSGIDDGINMGDIVLYILLYADDIVLISDSTEGLQKFLKVLFSFCEDSQMEENVKKTQIMIF